MIDGDAGPVVLNKVASWQEILAHAIRPTPNEIKPGCKGWRRNHALQPARIAQAGNGGGA